MFSFHVVDRIVRPRHEGGRLSKKLLLSYAETINKFFGCEIADKLDIKKTLIVEES